MEEKGHKTRALHVSPLESRSCSIEDEELGEVWDCLTAAGNSFFGGWLGLIIRIEMPTACFPTFSKNMWEADVQYTADCTTPCLLLVYNGVLIVLHPEEEDRLDRLNVGDVLKREKSWMKIKKIGWKENWKTSSSLEPLARLKTSVTHFGIACSTMTRLIIASQYESPILILSNGA